MPNERTIADLIEDRFGSRVEGCDEVAGADIFARILARRTHRRYADRPVPDPLLETMLACAFSASAKSDLQQSGVILVRDPQKRAAIAGWIPDMPWIAQAPVFMVWIGDSRRIRRVCALRDKPFGNDHLDSFLNATVDCALAMQTFILAAEAAGLGCCAISAVRNHAQALGALLDLPDWVFPVAGLCLGWPAREGFISARLPLSLTVHTDRYDDSDLAEEIDGYDRRREARHPTPPDQQRERERYGIAPAYGWSEDKARQVSRTERDNFGPFVRDRKIGLD
ncbi:MAG: nitroreductase family protein [Alphaproteobacteria bacterium]